MIFVIQKRSVSLFIGFFQARNIEPTIISTKEPISKIVDKSIFIIINFNFYMTFSMLKLCIEWGVRDLNPYYQRPRLAVCQVSVTPRCVNILEL